MNEEKARVPQHHFKQDLMIAVAAVILLSIFFLDKKFNNSGIFDTLLNRQSKVGESTQSKFPIK